MKEQAMNIKDYIYLYINSEALYRHTYVDNQNFTVWLKLTENRYRCLEDASIDKVEYALRRLSDMTEEDLKKMVNEFAIIAIYAIAHRILKV